MVDSYKGYVAVALLFIVFLLLPQDMQRLKVLFNGLRNKSTQAPFQRFTGTGMNGPDSTANLCLR